MIAVLGLGLVACSGDAPEPGGVDGGVDAASVDAAADGAADAALDAATDAVDAAAGSVDAGGDAAVADSGVGDASLDADPGCGPDGTECVPGGDLICVGGACVTRGCGDGWREPGEGCDDGNTAGGDACDPGCVPTRLAVAARAGEQDFPAGPRTAAAAADDGQVLVVWQASTGPRSAAVMARRYGRGGVPQGMAFVVDDELFSGWPAEPTVVGVASGWVVAWSSPDLDGAGAAVAVARVDGAGGAGVASVLSVTTAGDQRHPVLGRVAGQGVVAAWVDGSPGGGLTRVRARRVGEDGLPVGNELGWSDGGGAGRHGEPALVADGSGVIGAWSFSAGGTAPAVVHLRRFGATLAPVDPAPLLASETATGGAAYDGATPALARRSDGRYVLAWVTRRDDARGDVRWRLVEASGAAFPAPSQPLAATPGFPESAPSLAPAGDGVVALVHRGSVLSDLPRDLALVHLDVLAPPGAALLAPMLAGSGRQTAGALAATGGALWVVWADDSALPTPALSTLAFLLPE